LSAAPRPCHAFPTRRSSDLFDNNEIDVVVIDANEEAVNYTGTMSAADFDAYDADPTTDAAGTAKLITASVRFVDNDGDGKLNIADRKSTRLNSSHVSISYAV